MILVRFGDGTFRKVPEEVLGRLIRGGDITHFRRASGWVDAAGEQVRTHFSPLYQGPERRSRAGGAES